MPCTCDRHYKHEKYDKSSFLNRHIVMPSSLLNGKTLRCDVPGCSRTINSTSLPTVMFYLVWDIRSSHSKAFGLVRSHLKKSHKIPHCGITDDGYSRKCLRHI